MSDEGNTPDTGDNPGGAAGDTPSNDWRTSLPEQWRNAPLIGKAESADDALAQIQNAAQYMGNSIRIPGEDAGKEDWAAFKDRLREKVPDLMVKPDVSDPDSIRDTFKALGVPEKPDDYRYDIPEGREALPGAENLRKLAHEAGITQTQFEKLVGGMQAMEYEQNDHLDVLQREDMATLQKEWGFATDQKMEAVANWLKLTDAPESIQELAASKGLSAADYVWLHGIATSTRAASELTNLPKDETQTVLSPDEAEIKIQEMLNNHEHPYWNAAHRGHKAAIERMVELQRMRAGG